MPSMIAIINAEHARVISSLITLLAAIIGSGTALYIAQKVYRKQKEVDRSISLNIRVGEHYSKVIAAADAIASQRAFNSHEETYTSLFDLKADINTISVLDPSAPTVDLRTIFLFAKDQLHKIEGTRYRSEDTHPPPNIYDFAEALQRVIQYYQTEVLRARNRGPVFDLWICKPGTDVYYTSEDIKDGSPVKKKETLDFSSSVSKRSNDYEVNGAAKP